MKSKFLLSSLLCTAIILPGCASISSARDQLDNMSETKFQELDQKVFDTAKESGKLLKSLLLSDKPEQLAKLHTLTTELQDVIAQNKLELTDAVKYLLDRFANDLHLTSEQQELIHDAAKVIDAAVGQIRVDITGFLSTREKTLLLSLLRGLGEGVS